MYNGTFGWFLLLTFFAIGNKDVNYQRSASLEGVQCRNCVEQQESKLHVQCVFSFVSSSVSEG